MVTRLTARFESARAEGRGILMGFLPAGFPNPETFTASSRAAFASGLDALEVSMPGPAPELDGPLIQEAARTASAFMTSVPQALTLAAKSRLRSDDPIIALAYAHTLDALGPVGYLDALVAADVDACLLPQSPMAEQISIGVAAQARGIEPVIFLHLQEDLGQLANSDLVKPIIYLQSADLQTGGIFNETKARERLSELSEAFGRKTYFVSVGFGVRGPQEVATLMNAGADGAIVGTRLVTAATDGPEAVAELVDSISPALVGATGSR